jgi:RimJ/RimL family protein N-acetyltransferase
MFGTSIKISNNGLTLILRPGKESDIPAMVEGMSDQEVKRYLGRKGGVTEDIERDWMKKKAQEQDSMLWFIQPEGSEVAIGSTGLHGMDNFRNVCTSGFCIWDKEWWGKGVASLAHIARTYCAATQLNRFSILSEVCSPNIGSWKALEKVGYIRTGTQLRNHYVDGQFIDTYLYTWLNPLAISLLYPEGLPKEYVQGVEKAKDTLEKGKEYIKYL